MSWAQVGTGETLSVRDTYRQSLTIRAPYWTAGPLANAFKLDAAVRGHIEILSISHSPPLVSSQGVTQPWPFVMVFRVRPKPETIQAGLDPKVLWSLAGLVAAVGFALAISSKKLERLIETAGRAARDLIQEAINPGFVVLAFVVAVMFLKRR